jgi:hypothetical protein
VNKLYFRSATLIIAPAFEINSKRLTIMLKPGLIQYQKYQKDILTTFTFVVDSFELAC